MLQDGQQIKVNKPSDASFSPFLQHVTLCLRSDWSIADKKYQAGSLLLANYDHYNDYVTGQQEFEVLFTPTTTTSLVDFSFTQDHVILNILDNVKSRLVEKRLSGNPPRVAQERSIDIPENGTIYVDRLFDPTLPNDPLADQYIVNYKDFLTPDSLMLGRAGSDNYSNNSLKSLTGLGFAYLWMQLGANNL